MHKWDLLQSLTGLIIKIMQKVKPIRDETILDLRINGKMTLQEIANGFGLSRQRVLQIINKQLDKERSAKK